MQILKKDGSPEPSQSGPSLDLRYMSNAGKSDGSGEPSSRFPNEEAPLYLRIFRLGVFSLFPRLGKLYKKFSEVRITHPLPKLWPAAKKTT